MDVPLGQVLDGTLLEIRGENGEETQHGVLWIGTMLCHFVTLCHRHIRVLTDAFMKI